MKISASFLSIKSDLKEHINDLAKTNIDYLHLDIMDGSFVKNKTWSSTEIDNLVDNVEKPLDIHLMVSDIKSYVDDFLKFNPEYITFHYEACNDIDYMISYIKDKNVKVGISINPDTDVSVLYPYLNLIDLILVMSVNPGFGGQSFIASSVDKVNDLYNYRNSNNCDFLIEVDGGINATNCVLLKNADILVVGSFITNSDNYQQQINKIKG